MRSIVEMATCVLRSGCVLAGRRAVAGVLTAGLILILGAPTSAQYFGRNKVQYKQLDFQVLKTEHFDIYYYPSERQGIDIAARMAERWRARLGRSLRHELTGRQPLVLYASHPDFEQTNTIQGELGEGTGGVTEPVRRRIILPLGGPLVDTDHVIGHELVHAYQFDMTTSPGGRPGQTGVERLPLWFIEGMAEYLSLGPVDPNTAMWLRDAVREADTGKKDALPAIKDLDNGKYFPYRWGQAFWAYVAGRFGDEVIPRMLRIGGQTGDTDIAIEQVLGIKTKQLSDDWQASIRATYAPILAAAMPTNEIGRLVTKRTGFADDVNVGPSLSPDGKLIAFLSTRSVFSIDLFVAETATGNILHRLTSTADDPHFSSLQFIHSAGGWDAESRRIAIATVVAGRPALAIFDGRSGDKEREVPLNGLDEIFNPTWAPDGHAICFTGMSGGLTDLYVYDLRASTLRRLTNDAYADLQPAWSPDGRRIAFATDRFTSNLQTLAIGDYRLALIDPESALITPVRAFAAGKHINPGWMADSRGVLFISDHDGISNVYRVALEGTDIGQITKVATGISGITASSPALSIAPRSGLAAFTLYHGGKYDIYTVEVGRGTPPSTVIAGAGTLPPLDRRPSAVAAQLQDAATGLPAPVTYPSEPYKTKLSLEGLAQPSISVGASQFGAAVGGGIGLQFTDLLGNHTLITAAQVNSNTGTGFSFKNTAAQVAYLNSARRWNWGLVGGQTPYLSGGFQSGVGLVGNEPAQIDQQIIFRQTEQSVGGLVAYPFNRSQRIEFQTGVTRLSFDQIVQTTAFSLNTGQLLLDDSDETSLANPLTLSSSSAALVFDTSNFGATSPVRGQRYRLEASPMLGSVKYTGLLADYRRYIMPVSFYTIATRALHYGRYGGGGQDSRLQPLFLGYPNLVRGYDVGTFEAGDCLATAVSDCPAFDRLIGSRLLVGNIEFRFPLLRPFGVSQRMYGPLPVEVAFFADGGVAWNRGERPELFGGSRQGVGSAGIAFRVNLLGFAIGQFDFARPFQKARQGWVFQFNLSPGF